MTEPCMWNYIPVRLSLFLRVLLFQNPLRVAAADLGLPGMAVLDRNGFYGSPRFHMAAKKSGLRRSRWRGA